MFGFYRLALASPKIKLANPKANVKEIIELTSKANSENASIILFSELSLIGYSIGDLLFNSSLLNLQEEALKEFLNASSNSNIISVIGYALKFNNRLYNTALIIKNGVILGAVPKSYIPSKQEFYEARYFNSGIDIKNCKVTIVNQDVDFGTNLLFSDNKEMLFGVEICEDLWAVTPPSNQLIANGANLILNLSASNEIVGKSDYRASLVATQSARGICTYAYASSNLGESGSDTIFSGDLIVAEYGTILTRDNTVSIDSKLIYADIDLERVTNLRVNDTSYNQSKQEPFKTINIEKLNEIKDINRYFNPHPFVPSDNASLDNRAKEITDIQAYSLIRRLKQINITKSVIGISGGLDSTLALLSTLKAYEIAGFDKKDIIAITMPGFGTTSKTLTLAKELCKKIGVELQEIDISDMATSQLNAIEHSKEHDVTYENTQARLRTAILMNIANKEGGIVIGTGDLSEIALGWSTYNGDQMSMYGLNSGIPKTLIKYLIGYYAKDKNLEDTLNEILNIPISPELVPSKNNEMTQVTEDIIGPYELHDFFLYHFIRDSFSVKKILFIAQEAYKDKYTQETIKKWLKVFIKRFFTQQFKRNAMPDGVMIGTVSLSPRANWRMPSDADYNAFIDELD